MSEVVDRLVNLSLLSKRFDDDKFDRLSHRYSAALLFAAALLTGGRQLMSERIRCFIPAHFTFFQVPYINDYCYVASTYYIPDDGTWNISCDEAV